MRYHIDTIPVWDAAKIDGEIFTDTQSLLKATLQQFQSFK